MLTRRGTGTSPSCETFDMLPSKLRVCAFVQLLLLDFTSPQPPNCKRVLHHTILLLHSKIELVLDERDDLTNGYSSARHSHKTGEPWRSNAHERHSICSSTGQAAHRGPSAIVSFIQLTPEKDPLFCVPEHFTMSLPTKEERVKQYAEYGASETSFYTSAEKLDHYESLDEVLDKHCQDTKLRTVITDLLNVCAEITDALRTTLVTVEGIENSFGDKQLSVDVSLDD
jgi:hypothetical protein